MTRIILSDKTMIPLTWVVCAYIPTTTLVVGVALFANTVNVRLARIEHKLGIEPLNTKMEFPIKTAEAKEK